MLKYTLGRIYMGLQLTTHEYIALQDLITDKNQLIDIVDTKLETETDRLLEN